VQLRPLHEPLIKPDLHGSISLPRAYMNMWLARVSIVPNFGELLPVLHALPFAHCHRLNMRDHEVDSVYALKDEVGGGRRPKQSRNIDGFIFQNLDHRAVAWGKHRLLPAEPVLIGCSVPGVGT
jgi:hypothetical protein